MYGEQGEGVHGIVEDWIDVIKDSALGRSRGRWRGGWRRRRRCRHGDFDNEDLWLLSQLEKRGEYEASHLDLAGTGGKREDCRTVRRDGT